MNTFGAQCVHLRKKDKSIVEIARITGRAKSSIYPYIRDIPLSPQRMAAYRAASAKHIARFPLARKGKSVRPFTSFDAWTVNRVMLVAHFMFDGELNRSGCRYNNRSSVLIQRVEALMSEYYRFAPHHWIHSATGVRRISYYNVALSEYLRGKAAGLMKEVGRLPAEERRAFLRAFFDDEGCMDFRPKENRRSVRGYQKDRRVLLAIQKLLKKFNIESRIVEPNEVVISGRDNLERFKKEIDFSSGVRINGKRSNSIWKKHLEKRTLLKRALASYQ